MKSISSLFIPVFILISILYSQSLLSQQLVDIAKAQLVVKKGDFTIDTDDIQLISEHTSQQSGLKHFYFNQAHNGIKIYNAVSNVAIGKGNKVFMTGNRFVRFNTVDASQAILSSARALEEVAKEFKLDMTTRTTEVNRTSTVNKETILRNTSLSNKEIKTSLVYVHSDAKLHLCWSVAIQKNDDNFWWDVKVSAIDGSIVEKTSWTLECNFGHNEDACDHSNHSHDVIFQNHIPTRNSKTHLSNFIDGDYQVLPMPVESPNHGSIAIVNSPWTDNIDANAHPFDWHNDGSADYFTTRGNNVWAVEDRNGNGQSGSAFSPDSQLAGGQQYLYPPDFNDSPVDYQEAAITNLFYWNNIVHDVMYHYGFDEEAGNFQETNATNLGTGGDFVLADAQDGSGTNNATFGTPADGNSPEMTMFEWTQTPATTFEVTSPISATYFSIPASFGSNATFTGEVVEANDTAGGTHEACTANVISNGGALAGKIALIDRGNCSFVEKVTNAEAEGAIAVVVCNNVLGDPIAMGGAGPFPNIPSVMISQNDCATLRQNLPATIDVVTSTASLPNRDSDFDNGVIAHEYGHGISTRLTGGRFNSGCLNNQEQMGEGWSDFFGLILTMKSSDIGTQSKGVGTYLIGQPTTSTGIRQFPYSTDFAINPMTYNSSNTAAVPHGVGTVWCTALWEMTWELINIYGIGTDIYDADFANAGTLANPSTFGGQNLALQLVMEGLKLQPCSPGFVDGRDAILAADQALYGGIHECILWEAFARRGLGVNASQGSTNLNTDNVESFDTPSATNSTFSKLTANTIHLDGGSITYDLVVEGGACDNITNAIITDVFDSSLTITSVVCPTGVSNTVSGNNLTISAPNTPAGQSLNCTVMATMNSTANASLVSGIITDDVESGNIAWTINDISNLGNEQWIIDDNQSTSGSNSWFVIDTNGPDKTTALESIDLPLGTSPSLSFFHQYDTEADWDGGFIQTSIDGGATWVDLPDSAFTQNGYNGVLGASSNNFIANKDGWTGNSNGFIETRADLSSFANSTIQLRFVYGQDNNTNELGWWLDDITIDLDNMDIAVVPNLACYESDQTSMVCDGAIALVEIVPCLGFEWESGSPSSTNQLCNTPLNTGGSVAAVAIGGTLPISYLWEDSNGNTINPNRTSNPGDYFVTATDGAGCELTGSVTILPVIPEYTSANGNMLTGNQSTSEHYEVPGAIESDQQITGLLSVDYDSGTSITLESNFSVGIGSVFHAYIDGCNGNALP
jgi:phage baseplate assembly protein gpV